MKLAALSRNGAKNRVRNRCALTGRPRSFHGKFNLSRISLRKLASEGQLPGVVKSSW
jgi:small subunit ribosomal protein S14